MARKNVVQKSGRSPYNSKNKAPYRYSELYYRWRDAFLNGRTAEARRLSEQHRERFFGKFAVPPQQLEAVE